MLRALDRAQGFRTAQELHAAMRREGERIGLTTVYRHVNRMAEAGVVDAVHAGDGSVAFRHCKLDHHHHHVVCRTCGASVVVDAPEIEDWVAKASRAAGFTDVSHTLEVFGTCRTCAGPRRPARRR
ncbi:MAG TPA: Fur family transcriptional regulator [Mycobacteriales bacterium]|nr:Fur family transcriptional regulator [Mycobacteriales bacterium]